MSDERFELHDKILHNIAAQGDDGARWRARLPGIVAALERDWSIKVGKIFPNATEAFVAEAVGPNGELAALKIPLTGFDKSGRELAVLRAANGQGYARLLRHDPGSGAMLLERLGPQLSQMGLQVSAQIEIICATLHEAWRTPPAGLELVTGREKAEGMGRYIELVWPRLRGPCSDRVFTAAMRFVAARRDAFDPATSVLGHGDAHCWNTLRSPHSGDYRFVDPDGLFIERAHDLSISMREWSTELLAGNPVELGRQRCDLLAALAGVDATAIWQWGFIERLVNGLRYLEVGPQRDAAEFLEVVEAWATQELV